MKTNEKIVKAFTIFLKYEDLDNLDPDVYAEHDVIYCGPDPEIVSEEDKLKLEELGFGVDTEFNCFYYFT